MYPLVAIMGRTNVGKSTLFNRLAGEKKALTHNRPGVTRDRIYAESYKGVVPFSLVDTGGLDPDGLEQDMERSVFEQAREAIEEADLILFVVDGKAGLTPLDERLAFFVRRSNKSTLLVVNKVDGPELEGDYVSEFYCLGFEMIAVSAAYGYGKHSLLESIDLFLPEQKKENLRDLSQESAIQVALLGRPNVGKSSMINAFVGERRLIVNSEPGTTRDCVDVVLEKGTSRYVFLDSAGVRRPSRIKDSLEQFSILRTLKQSKKAHVTILVVDSDQGITFQDKRLISALERDKTPMVVAVNKIDLIPRKDREQLKRHVQGELRFCAYVPTVFTSSVTKAGLGGILPLIDKLWSECNRRVGTGELNRALGQILRRQQPPMVKHRRAKFYYMTQAETSPPTFVFFMNDQTLIKTSYQRYLEKQIRKIFGFTLAPIQLYFRTSQG